MIYKGDKLIANIYIGGQSISHVYNGDELVYQKNITRPLIIESTVASGDVAGLPVRDISDSKD